MEKFHANFFCTLKSREILLRNIFIKFEILSSHLKIILAFMLDLPDNMDIFSLYQSNIQNIYKIRKALNKMQNVL